MRTNLLILPLLILTLLLAACGFHLRGQGGFTFPFQTLFIQTSNANASFILDLKRAVQLYNVKLVDSPENAQLTLHIVSEIMSKQILSLNSAGRVNEYQLNYRVSFRAYDSKQQEWIPADELMLQNYLAFDNIQVLAKEMEEVLLYKDMRNDAVQQILRRLSLAKPPPSPQ